MKPTLGITQAVVKEITGETCTVTIGELDLTDVRLKATSLENNGKLMITPKVGSVVLVGSLTGDLKDLAVLSVDEAQKIEVSGEVIFNEGKNDGMVLVKELTEKLNNLEKDINALKQAFTSWVPTPQDGGAGLKAGTASWSGQRLMETNQSEIENQSIKQ